MTELKVVSRTIVLVATLDTKGEEAKFVRDEIVSRGHKVIVVDAGVMGLPFFKADVSREEVALEGGKSIAQIVVDAEKGANRADATNIMIKGLQKIVKELYQKKQLAGIIALGGGTGTALGAAAMKVLPVGVPKLLVSVFLQPETIGSKDITVMQTPADIIGLNRIMKQTLANAAGAISGMAEAMVFQDSSEPLIAITSLGVTTPALMKIRVLLSKAGYESLVVTKTEVLDELIENGKIDGIIDLSCHEIYTDVEFRKPPQRMAEDRLEIAGKRGLPQIIIPGGLDLFILIATKKTVPSIYESRALHVHSPDVVLARTNKDEMGNAARILAERANRALGPVSILIPTRGFSAVDKEGQDLFAPEVDQEFGLVLKKIVNPGINVMEVNAHINDDEFARSVFDNFKKVMDRRSK